MNPILAFLVAWIEGKYPGSKPYVDFALSHIDADKLQALLLQALNDHQHGMSFQDLLKGLLQQNMPVAAAAQMPA